MRAIVLAATLIALITTAAPTAVADDSCTIDGVLCHHSETAGSPDCPEGRHSYHHYESTRLTVAGTLVAVDEDTVCRPTRDGHYDHVTTSVTAEAFGARAHVEYSDFTDSYWGQYFYVSRGVSADLILPEGTTLGASHYEGGFTDPTFPDPHGCWTSVYVEFTEMGTGTCTPVAPLVLLP